MSPKSVDEKQEVYELIERLAPGQISALVRFLEVMLDPVARSIANAPVEEEEEILPQLAAELDAAHASIARGEGIPHQEILRQFKIKPR